MKSQSLTVQNLWPMLKIFATQTGQKLKHPQIPFRLHTNIVNVIIFDGEKHAYNAYSTFHVGAIFILISLWCCFRMGNFQNKYFQLPLHNSSCDNSIDLILLC